MFAHATVMHSFTNSRAEIHMQSIKHQQQIHTEAAINMCELVRAEQCVPPLSLHSVTYRARLLILFAFLRPKLRQRTNTDNTCFVVHQNLPSNHLLYPRQSTHAVEEEGKGPS